MITYENALYPPLTMSTCAPEWSLWESLYSDNNFIQIGANFNPGATEIRKTGLLSRWGKNNGSFIINPGNARLYQSAVSVKCPAAFKIASLSATKTFEQAPSITSDDASTQEIIDLLTTADFISTLREAETLSSIYGGVFLKLAWNLSATDRVKVKPVTPVSADPVFVNGELREVSFITEFDGFYRLVETHAVEDGNGVVTFRLYKGTDQGFGHLVPLADCAPAWSSLHEVEFSAELGDGFYTGLDHIDVVYVKNPKSCLRWKETSAEAYGASDFYGSEGTMEQLNYVMSQRDEEMRTAKSKIIIDEKFAQYKPGSGLTQDIDRSVFTLLSLPTQRIGTSDAPTAQPLIQHFQGNIRNDQFKIAIDEAWRSIASVAGFSLSSLGISGDDLTGIQTATGVRAASDATDATVAVKRGEWSAALETLVALMVAEYRALQGAAAVELPAIAVRFAVTSGDEDDVVTTVSTLVGAGLMSKKQALRSLHPDWDESQIDAELEQLHKESRVVDIDSQNTSAPMNGEN